MSSDKDMYGKMSLFACPFSYQSKRSTMFFGVLDYLNCFCNVFQYEMYC